MPSVVVGSSRAEFLGNTQKVALAVPGSARPGCGFRLIARYPCLVVLLIYSLCIGAGAGVYVAGDLNLSAQSELFKHASDVEVHRLTTYVQMGYTSYSGYQNWYRRQMSHLPDGSTVGCDHPTFDAWQQVVLTYEIVYSARGPLLTPGTLQRILLLEKAIREWIDEVCVSPLRGAALCTLTALPHCVCVFRWALAPTIVRPRSAATAALQPPIANR
jgi:hypothetical protein